MTENGTDECPPRVLILEDAPGQLRTLSAILADEGFGVIGSGTASEALEHLAAGRADVAIVDLRLPDLDESGLLRKLAAYAQDVPVIIHTAYSSYESAKGAINGGAFAYVEKAGGPAELVRQVHRAVQACLRRRAGQLEAAVAERTEDLSRSNDALREARAYAESIIDSMANMLVVVSPAGRIVTVNEATCARLGYSENELIGQPASLLFQEEEGEEEEEEEEEAQFTISEQALPVKRTVLRRLVEEGSIRNIEKSLLARNGEKIRVLLSGSIMRHDRGEIRGIVCLALDITERKQAEEALHQSEERLRLLFENTHDLISLADSEARTLWANPAWRELLGSIEGRRNPFDLLHPDDLERIRAAWQGLVERGVPIRDIEYRFASDAGEYRTFMTSAFPAALERRRCYYVVAHDITERKRAEEEAKKLQKQIDYILGATNTGIDIIDSDFDIRYINPEWQEHYGDPAGRKCYEYFMGRSDVCPGCGIVKALETKQPTVTEEVLPKEGNRPVQVTVIPFQDENGDWLVAEVNVDIRERVRMEEQLRQAQKMEAVGQLAGGVAHDFRNQLMVVEWCADSLLRRGLVSEEGRYEVQEIIKAARRSTDLTTQLLAFSRKEALRPQRVELGELVSQVGASLQPMIGEDVRLSVAEASRPCWADLDPGQLQQAVVNLAVNARDAMPGGGELTIGVDCVHRGADSVKGHPNARPGRYAVLSVTDTGVGMDEETRTRIFEPFYTTKEVGKGTGLGLSMVYGFVEQSRGFVEVDSRPGAGSTFRLCFPCVDTDAQPAQPAAAPEEFRGGTETILVVEDEAPVRELVVAQLQQLGYTVLEAANSREALSRVEGCSGRISLLITDIVMPEGSGLDLAGRVQADRPEIRVLYMSGYSGKDLARRGLASQDINLLAKPFSAADLARSIRATLAGPAARESRS